MTNSGWTQLSLRRLITVQSGDSITAQDFVEQGTPVFGGNGFRGYYPKSNTPADTILVGRVGALCGNIHRVTDRVWATEHAFRVRKIIPAETGFLEYLLRSLDLGQYASRSAQPVLNSDAVRNHSVGIPDLPTQRAIADFLDRETARIDLLIEKKQRLLDMVSPRFEALIHAARSESRWRRFGFCVKSTTRPIPNISDQSFVPLGLYNRGRGFFKKSDTDFDELGDSSFFFVEEGDLVFSGQFAWEGAVGLVSEHESGCVVSHRYPVYVGTEGVISEYLYAYFRSHHGRFLMDNCSRGAAGRNRPLNTRILEKEKIPVPPLPLQDEVKNIVLFERRLKGKITPSIDRLREYRSALITAAVTGQINVAEWCKAGTNERRLDAIQAEFQA